MAEPQSRIEHSLSEDAFAFVLGTAVCALGLQLLTAAGLITGQTAGLGVLISYLTGWSFGVVFFVVNLPFYILAISQMGVRFTVKTAIAVALVSVMADTFPLLFDLDAVQPLFGALLGGACIGLGLLVIFRHGASLGGVGVLALWLQDRVGVQAGWVQLGFDAVLFAVAFFALDPLLIAMSLAGAAVVNLIVAVNHRKDRYVGR
ncbi:MAG: YitT family protein [Pseudomonadota bacterium]